MRISNSFSVLNLVMICFSLFFTFARSDTEYDGPLYAKLHHHLGSSSNPEWSELGLVVFQNINTGSISMNQQDIDSDTRAKLQELANNGSLYRMKAVVTTSKGKETGFQSFLEARSLMDKKSSNILTISLDQSGSVVGISISTKEFIHVDDIQETDLVDLNVYPEFKTIEPGPVPDTASYVQKIEKEREAKERGATQDNRSFFAKYWMYIVPIVLFAVLSGSTNTDASSTSSR